MSAASALSPEQSLSQALSWRYATKLFDREKKIPTEHWQLLKDSLRLAPSSYGLQPWKFIVVENPELRAKLREKAWGQSQVTDASHYVVLAALRKLSPEDIARYSRLQAQVRSLPADKEAAFTKMGVDALVEGPRSQTIGFWAERQVYLAFGFAMLAAAGLGIDSCPLEGLDPKAYDQILGLEGSPYATVAGLALGYRSERDRYQHMPKVRFAEEDVFEVR